MLEEQLKKFGLSEKEAKTYITLLVLGESTAAEVAKESGVNRSSAYVVLEALQKKGLAKATESGKVQKFRAAPPEKLTQIAEKQLKEQEEINKAVYEILPSLKGVDKNQRNRPEIMIYEGIEGIKFGFEDTILNNKEKVMRVISSVTEVSKLLPKTYFPNYIRKRYSSGIRMVGIHPMTNFSKKIFTLLPKLNQESVLIPQEKFTFDTDIAIYDDKVSLMTHEDGGHTIIIKNHKISETMKGVFDLAFMEAKRLDQNN